MIKKKIVRRSTTVKTRNAGTMTESAFWSFIRSALRQKSRWWKPITQCKLEARRAYTGPLKVDHIVGAGSLNCADDLPGFVDRLFCEQDNLQVLCETCHDKKTKLEKSK